MEAQLQELVQFLNQETRLDVKTIALSYVLGLTATTDGRSAISKQRDTILKCLLDLTLDKSHDVSHNAYMAIISLSGHEEFAEQLIQLNVIPRLIESLTKPSSAKDADMVSMILSNLTRSDQGAESFAVSMESPNVLYKLVDIFDKQDSVRGSCSLHYLAPVFSNVTKVQSVRLIFLDKQVRILPRLTPYIQYQDSLVRRGGVIGLIRNLCFETSYHEWLLSPEIDLLPYLLLPLAGPEQFSEEETESLPLDLQYLPDDKQREADPDLRKMIIETLLKLCATKHGRCFLKDSNAYLILRELDRWEKEESVQEACQNVIAILIADEPEPDMSNLDEVEIPEDIVKKFDTVDKKQENNE